MGPKTDIILWWISVSSPVYVFFGVNTINSFHALYCFADRESIMIFGQSHGMIYVSYLSVSPLAADLFKSTIMESGGLAIHRQKDTYWDT